MLKLVHRSLLKRMNSSLIKGLELESEKQLEIPILESDINQLYEALTAPVATTIGPESQKHLKLSQSYLERLKVNFKDTDRALQSSLTERNDKLAVMLKKPNLAMITELIHVNALAKNQENAVKAFDAIKQNGLEPDIVAYNHLLNAHASVNDSQKAFEVYELIKKESEPDLVTYSTLIKLLVNTKQLHKAFELYAAMKKKKIHPNQIVFTTLIKGCIQFSQIDRAWKTFNHMRSEIERPDSIAFTLMIYACSKTQDAERALDLFQEMISNNLQVTQVTYTSLILACGSRADYYNEAFDLLEQMIATGFEPNIHTYNVLLQIASKNNDIDRVKTVWNDLITRGEANQELQPTSVSFKYLLRTYTSALKTKPTKTISAEEQEKNIGKQFEIFKDEKKDPPSNSIFPVFSDSTHSTGLFIKESNELWDKICYFVDQKMIKMTSELLVERLDNICAQPTRDNFDKALQFFDHDFEKYGVVPTAKAYRSVLKVAFERKGDLKQKAIPFWNRFLEWDSNLEDEMKNMENGPKGLQDQEEFRLKTNRSRKVLQDSFLIVARGFARNDDLNSAIETLENARNFRQPYYLPPIKLSQISNLMEKATREADNGDHVYLQKLSELCPPVHHSPVSQVQSILKKKTIPKNWWGWQAIGIPEHERIKMVRKSQKLQRKKMDIEMTIRRRAEKSYQNRSAKESKQSTMDQFNE
ncbi:hypothetical protein HDV06_002150 [Boothiomyces sp. JEL0866]|nr:hypothetical protein HDV06_002150 [Boothiomyces sp. JEL0866]